MTSITKNSLQDVFRSFTDSQNQVVLTQNTPHLQADQNALNKLNALAKERFSENIEKFCPQKTEIDLIFLPLFEKKFKQSINQETSLISDEDIPVQEKKDYIFNLFNQLIAKVYAQLAAKHPQKFLETTEPELQFSSISLCHHLSQLKLGAAYLELFYTTQKTPSSSCFCEIDSLCFQILQLVTKHSEIDCIDFPSLVCLKIFDFYKELNNTHGNIYLRLPDNTEFFIYKIPPSLYGKDRDLYKSWILIRNPHGEFLKYEKTSSLSNEGPKFFRKELTPPTTLPRFYFQNTANLESTTSRSPFTGENSPQALSLELYTDNSSAEILEPLKLNIPLLSLLDFLQTLIQNIEKESSSATLKKKVFLNDHILNTSLGIITQSDGALWIEKCLEVPSITVADAKNIAKEISITCEYMVNELITLLSA